MYVKLYSRILDSSIASNRKLRHLFTDLLLLSDRDGNVILTKQAIANRIGADLEEVEWGIEELMKPDPDSLTPDFGGRRIVPLEGHGYGWRIVNYSMYRDCKSAEAIRQATAERVRRYRERHGKKVKGKSAAQVRREAEGREKRYMDALERDDVEEAERIASEDIPESKTQAQSNGSNGQPQQPKPHTKSFVLVPGEGLRKQ